MIRQIDDKLYQVVCGWWASYKWPVCSRDTFPQRGYVSFIEDKPICAGFLYKDETANFGLMDYIVCNPESTREERSHCISETVDHIESVAKELGVKKLVTMSVTERLTQKLETLGYIKLQDFSHLIKII